MESVNQWWDKWTWKWTNVCPTGLTPWVADSNDLMPCFQEVCLQFPIYALFAIFSSYYFGLHNQTLTRNSTQLRLLYLRVISTILLALIPLTKIYYFAVNNVSLYPADVLITSTKCLTWIVHSCKYQFTYIIISILIRCISFFQVISFHCENLED